MCNESVISLYIVQQNHTFVAQCFSHPTSAARMCFCYTKWRKVSLEFSHPTSAQLPKMNSEFLEVWAMILSKSFDSFPLILEESFWTNEYWQKINNQLDYELSNFWSLHTWPSVRHQCFPHYLIFFLIKIVYIKV